ncbi:MAG: TonB-dependent receptor [Candidatus Parabeggiatoa sp. nov. 3]|nr:MAG: TonB-dependent receptor [Gammaproteobacteria bacterium]RKZ67634.1 MAG: TonB-dependent receptor [Gammaproteobacteria bacterium]RKZ88646.1 MAG: TonB-dependent receptor [Gammaproteobacteria bacterium]
MSVKNQRHFFLRCVLTLALFTSTAEVQAIAQLTGTTSIQSLVLLVSMAAAETTNENGDIDMDSLGLSLAELFDLEVTIATGAKQTVAKAPAVTTVITAHDIEAIGAKDLRQVLNTVPGFFASHNFASWPNYTIRGISSSENQEVLMLVNGIRMNHSDTGEGGGLTMPALHAISRIEIIRGPGSAVYGADAFAGVINIITKTAAEIQGTEVGMRVGNLDTENAWVSHGDTWNGFDVMLAFEHNTTDGSGGIIDSDAQTIFDRMEGTNASLAPGPYALGRRDYDVRLDIQKGNWQFRAGYHDFEGELGAGATEALTSSISKQKRFNTELVYHNPTFTEYWDVTTQLSYLHMERPLHLVLYPAGAFGLPYAMTENLNYYEQHPRLDVSGFYSRFDKHLIRLGTGYAIDDQYKITDSLNFRDGQEGTMVDRSDQSDAWAPEVDRDSWYVFLQDRWIISPEWEFTAGIRYDNYSDFGSTTNPRAAVVWQPQPNFTTKLLFGRAFLAPTFDKLYIRTNPLGMGNPNLKPETIETWELAFDHQATETLHFAFNLFHYDIKDKMLYVPDYTTELIRTAQNVGGWTGHGLEFETRWKMTSKSSLLFNYAFQNSEDDETGKELGNSPEHQAYLRTDWLLFPNWFLNSQINWVADWSRKPGDPRKKVDDSTTVDLTLRHKNINKNRWNFAVGVRNLFDEDVHIPSFPPDTDGLIYIPNDYPLYKRSYWLELGYKF